MAGDPEQSRTMETVSRSSFAAKSYRTQALVLRTRKLGEGTGSWSC